MRPDVAGRGLAVDFEAPEVLRVLLGVAVLPALFHFIRLLRLVPGRPAWMTCLGAIYASYAFTVIEGMVAHGFFNVLQHSMYAVGGVAAAVGAVATYRSRELRGERR